METANKFNWAVGAVHEQIEIARRCSEDQLRKIARACDWTPETETVLGWIMAQRCIDLCTALQVFTNAGPERLNYVSKRHVENADLGRARLLDNICLRINCGFYLPLPGTSTGCHEQVAEWVSYQTTGRHEGREGRWSLDEKILQSLLEESGKMVPHETAPPKAHKGIWRSMFMVPAR